MAEEKKTHKVFRTWKFLAIQAEIYGTTSTEYLDSVKGNKYIWIHEFDGLAPDEIAAKGFRCSDLWCVEEPIE